MRSLDRLLTALRLRPPTPTPATPLSIFDLVPPGPKPAVTPAAPAANQVLLELQNRYGSVEHYFHFVLGFMVPLILRPPPPAGASVIVRSCGPMDAHLLALGLPWLTIIPKDAWLAQELGGETKVERACGFDDPAFYDPAAFQRARGLVWQRAGIADPPPDQTVLLVNRGRSPDYYQSAAVEVKTSANLRRTVPNMAEVEAAFAQDGWPVRTVELETAAFREQVALFAGTRIMVAQHGAALVNMMWMAPKAAIVEINPVPPGNRFHSYFRLLAEACGHRYAAVAQRGPYAAVPAGEVRDAVRALEDGGTSGEARQVQRGDGAGMNDMSRDAR